MDADKQACRRVLAADQVALAVEVFRMLADPTRVQLLWSLIDRELPVNELAAQLNRLGPAVWQHLAKLRMARLVSTRRSVPLPWSPTVCTPAPTASPRWPSCSARSACGSAGPPPTRSPASSSPWPSCWC
ncbi:winged helix-turn-helix transcriptional regulator [Nakamurella sp. YIM 132084]|uniref:Winged helix-turn-helix transcriptional regulator n=1 Tax=Nakamurella leprariae TaxID=2803911 RepID=A0A938YAV6_9ACTN|nr:winged helix-turn-helix transcriptional regulator [Nakamurella leprariae]